MVNIGHAEAGAQNIHSAQWLISPSVCVIIKICKKHLVLKTNSKIYIKKQNINFFITTLVSQFANSSLFFKSAKYLKNPQ